MTKIIAGSSVHRATKNEFEIIWLIPFEATTKLIPVRGVKSPVAIGTASCTNKLSDTYSRPSNA